MEEDVRPGGRAMGARRRRHLVVHGRRGLVQNFFYQRIFWFLLGLTASIGAGGMTKASNPQIFLAAVTGLLLVVFVLAL